jgi:hypothetical protein
MLVFDRLVTVGIVEHRQFSRYPLQFVELRKFEIDMFDRNLFVIGEIGGVIAFVRFKLDYRGFNIYFGHL